MHHVLKLRKNIPVCPHFGFCFCNFQVWRELFSLCCQFCFFQQQSQSNNYVYDRCSLKKFNKVGSRRLCYTVTLQIQWKGTVHNVGYYTINPLLPKYIVSFCNTSKSTVVVYDMQWKISHPGGEDIIACGILHCLLFGVLGRVSADLKRPL